jgi:molybdate transport system substrate-binding protein
MRRTWACAAAATVLLWCTVAAAGPLTVYVAASAADAMEAIGARWKARTGHAIRFSFAASSTLAKQIEAGADASLFLSADRQWMDYLVARDLLIPGTRLDLLGNRLVVVVPLGDAHCTGRASTPVTDAGALPGLLDCLLSVDGRLATGDPAHVPVGIYAREALNRLELWSKVAPRLVPADSVRAALALVERGEAPVGIVYATDAAPTRKVRVVAEIPSTLHTPIVYPLAMIAGHDSPAARELLVYLQGPEAHAEFARAGFLTLHADTR